MQLETRLGMALASDEFGFPTFPGEVISRYRGAKGKTPWEGETGRKCERRPFGKRPNKSPFSGDAGGCPGRSEK